MTTDPRLIAQAPAMLRALQNLVETLEGMAVHPSHYAQARATIARATGQPEPDEDEGPEPPYAGYESEAELRRMAEVRALRELVQYVKDEFSCSHPLRDAADRAHAAISAATED